jgi:hypothetical protein
MGRSPPYLRFGGLLAGWQDPQGVFFVTLSGVAFKSADVKVRAEPAIRLSAAILVTILPRLRHERLASSTRSMVALLPVKTNQ